MFKPEHQYVFFKIYVRKAVNQYLGNLNYIEYVNLMSDKTGWTNTSPAYKRDLKDRVRWIIDNLYYTTEDNELKHLLNEIEKLINKYTELLFNKYGDKLGKVQDN